MLEANGAVGDRDFLLIDHVRRPVSVTIAGGLLCLSAHYDARAQRLIVAEDGGEVWEDEIRVSDDVVSVDFLGHHEVAARFVVGAWNDLFSRFARRPVTLVKTIDPGAGSDLYPATLLGEASLRELGRRSGLGDIDSRRFRMLLQFSSSVPHVEDTWSGETLAIGHARVSVTEQIPRCAATTRHPDRGNRDAPIVKAIRAYRGLVPTVIGPGVPFGMYARVTTPGRVRVGDSLSVEGTAENERRTTDASEKSS
jgi:uncharacterized protein YcbX